MSLQGKLSAKSKMNAKLSLPEARAYDYERLKNIPKINDVSVKGNKGFGEYGMVEATNIQIDEMFNKIFGI